MLPAHTGFSPKVVASAMFKRNPCELPKIIISPSHISRSTNTSTPDLAHHFPHNIRQTQWPCGPPPPANGRSCRGKRGLGRSCKARIAPVQSLEGGFLVCTRNRKAHAVAWQTGHELQRPNRKAGNQPPSIAYLADGLTSFSLSFTGDHSQQPCSCTSTRHNTILHQPACLRLPPSSRRPPIRLEAALALPPRAQWARHQVGAEIPAAWPAATDASFWCCRPRNAAGQTPTRPTASSFRPFRQPTAARGA